MLFCYWCWWTLNTPKSTNHLWFFQPFDILIWCLHLVQNSCTQLMHFLLLLLPLTGYGRGHNSRCLLILQTQPNLFSESIQICFCAAYCTRRVNVLYKVFRSGIRFSPNSISQFSGLSGAFIILTVADKAIIFFKQLQNVDKCFCDRVSVWREGEHKYYSNSHWWHCSPPTNILCFTKETHVTRV